MNKRTYNNVAMEVDRFSKNKDASGNKFNKTEFVDIMSKIPFDKISIPLYSYKCLIHNNDSMPGNAVCGYIEGYNADTDTFNVVVHERYTDVIGGYDNPIIFPRVVVDRNDSNKIVMIKGFDICPRMYYSFVR